MNSFILKILKKKQDKMKRTIISIALIAFLGFQWIENVQAEGGDETESGGNDVKTDDNPANGSDDASKLEDNSVKSNNTNNNDNKLNNVNQNNDFTSIPMNFFKKFFN